jgi:hypothetical protein
VIVIEIVIETTIEIVMDVDDVYAVVFIVTVALEEQEECVKVEIHVVLIALGVIGY